MGDYVHKQSLIPIPRWLYDLRTLIILALAGAAGAGIKCVPTTLTSAGAGALELALGLGAALTGVGMEKFGGTVRVRPVS
jgi:hypothetical protein